MRCGKNSRGFVRQSLVAEAEVRSVAKGWRKRELVNEGSPLPLGGRGRSGDRSGEGPAE